MSIAANVFHFALLGLVALAALRRRVAWETAAAVAITCALAMMFASMWRYALPSIPYLVVTAGAALIERGNRGKT
jgi:hypothetical protein